MTPRLKRKYSSQSRINSTTTCWSVTSDAQNISLTGTHSIWTTTAWAWSRSEEKRCSGSHSAASRILLSHSSVAAAHPLTVLGSWVKLAVPWSLHRVIKRIITGWHSHLIQNNTCWKDGREISWSHLIKKMEYITATLQAIYSKKSVRNPSIPLFVLWEIALYQMNHATTNSS
jgi:hypothetical protein